MSNKRKDSKGRVLRTGESQRPDGKYMFRYTDNSGKRMTVYSWKLVHSDKSRDGIREEIALRDLEKQIAKDLEDKINTVDAESTTVDDLFEQFMDIRKDLKESSRCCYMDLYRKHVSPAIGSRKINQIKPTEIQKLYQTMISNTGISPSTVQKIHSLIYQLFENAVLDNLLRTNPADRAFQNIRKTTDLHSISKEPLTVEQQENLIDYIYQSKRFHKIANLFTVLLGTGMRIGEALGLRWCDCDFQNGIIRVTHALLYKRGEDGRYRYRISSPKTAAGFREIPMFNDVREALLREQKNKCKTEKEFTVDGFKGFIFLNSSGQVYTQSCIYDLIQAITTSYNQEEYFKALEEDRDPHYLPKISAHIFRHTFCTRMSENNINIKVLQDVMGHRNIRTTMETYTKAMREKKIEEIQSLDGSFKLS